MSVSHSVMEFPQEAHSEADTVRPLLEVKNLCKHFSTPQGVVQAVNDVSLTVPRGSITGLVGESGSGKTTLGRTLLRLIEPTSGQILFNGQDLGALSRAEMRAMRRRLQIIFQDPVSSLNPRLRVGKIVAEGLFAHGIGSRQERRERVGELLLEVGLTPDYAQRFPHELSGGQRQRVGIARALALEPQFIVADESVSALDVSIQAQVLNLLHELRERRNLTLLFIAHDLSVVEYLCDQTVVMYLGRVVESGPTRELYGNACHPYTQALVSAIPAPRPGKVVRQEVLSGEIPSSIHPPSGCVFRSRCPHAVEACAEAVPEPVQLSDQHESHCLRVHELSDQYSDAQLASG